MAVFLNDLYYDTKKRYNLKLISGGKGMENIVKWVYISEDISTSEFLNGGELIITTGVTSGEREDWLRAFIKGLIRRGTCGLILNVGKYIFEEDITDEIVRMCQRYSFPLFTMPWDTKIFDITHDYYNRIFEDAKDDGNLTGAFQNILMGNDITQEQADTILSSGFDNGYFNVLSIDAEPDEEFMYVLRKACNNEELNFHAFVYEGRPVVVSRYSSASSISDKCHKVSDILQTRFPDSSKYEISDSPESGSRHTSVRTDHPLRIGSGSTVMSIYELPVSYRRAVSARQMAGDNVFCDYNNLGFLRLLLEVNDRKLTDSYIREQLGRVMEYDRTHHSQLTDTLREYLLCSGSIQQISEHMFCHRNTINYRLRIIKEELEYDLADAEVRFQLMAAFKLKKLT